MSKLPENKTWKREVAVTQLLLHSILVAITVWMIVYYPDRNHDNLVSLVTGMAVWVYGLAGACFGVDSYAKQIKRRPDV